MEELLQAPTEGVGDAIVVPAVLANQFELKVGLLNLVTAISFHGFANDDSHSHIRRFTTITQTIKLNQVPHDIIKLILFQFSLGGAARTWLKKEPPNSITTWDDLVSKFVNKFFPPSRITNLRNDIKNFQQKYTETFNQDSLNSAAGGNLLTRNTQEALTIIKNKSKVRTSRNKPQVSSSIGSSSQNDAITALTKQVEALGKHIAARQKLVHSIQESCETCGGPHHYSECQATGGFTQGDVYAATGNYNTGGALPSNTIPNPWEDIKVITTRSGITLAGPSVPPPNSSSSSKEVERDPEPTMNQPLISYPSRLNKDKLQDKSDIQITKFLEIFKKLHFNINLVDALAQMSKYAKMLKDLLTNKEKLIELANTPLNENCSAVVLNKLLEKLRDPRKFLIPCYFKELEVCMSLADQGARFNLMPLSIYQKLNLGELKPTRMSLELANRSVTYPVGIAKDVFVQVDKFTFPADFVVVNYDVDPRVPFILGRPFLRTARTLVDVYGEELTLRVGDEKLIFNVESTSKYPH
ncbi:reverse transcriptase domain-containing protein [Tanacetum coccineum]|uniref:Reverse transcriptase domain-containing protein n=1 Tax=Tanacetum coccineum TaxID=301880 RepID=A0ABQ5GMR5_9ASTR